MKLTSEMVKAKAAELGIDCIAIGNIERFRGAPKLMSPLTYFPEARSVIAVAMRIPQRHLPRHRGGHALAQLHVLFL